ncbi:hypothetical protein S7711_02554 [Stachybotrys chartarum IBT 7711]|uniref:AB hydrolase-1 domain-containing protein n=1 Tax=Stachybotrys chartarum (strain CBS 109288 / IBT 7711) TaxID=1280523 RepID=A0A084B5E2_STACB|nr:hypothetical protein S7711_02554 [Stachybotrys chartarum IBT 7711]
MAIHSPHLRSAILVAAACLSVFVYIRPRATLSRTVIRANASVRQGVPPKQLPYPPDVFPGGRDVETPYGKLKVFEWGPEDGKKVLLLHGIATPCIAMGDMAHEFVNRGCRVMIFDFFGRGYSDAPSDLPYDDRLYTTQILLALASSPLAWTGNNAFHLLGYSLGGAIAASFAAYYPHLLQSVTLTCPGGLVRNSHISWKSWLFYSDAFLPVRLRTWLVERRLQPNCAAPAEVPDGDDADIDFDAVFVSSEKKDVTVGGVIEWQLESNRGFVPAYMSTIRLAPIYNQHESMAWDRLRNHLAQRRHETSTKPEGLPSGRICLILAERDVIVKKDEWIEDSRRVLGSDAVDIHVMRGGHEIGISKGKEIAGIVVQTWATTTTDELHQT